MTVRESQGQAEQAILQIILTIDHVAQLSVSVSLSICLAVSSYDVSFCDV